MLWFHCDESYDSQFNDPYCVCRGGAVAMTQFGRRVEDGFSAANLSAGVTEYHRGGRKRHLVESSRMEGNSRR